MFNKNNFEFIKKIFLIKVNNNIKLLELKKTEIKEIQIFNIFVYSLYLTLKEFENIVINLDFNYIPQKSKFDNIEIIFFDETATKTSEQIYKNFFEIFKEHIKINYNKYFELFQNCFIRWSVQK